MKKVYQFICGALCAVLLFGAAACGNDAKNSAGNDQNGEQESNKEPEEEPDALLPAYSEEDARATLTLKDVVEGDEGKISDELFGVFLEDINYASYALDDNMVKNGSFQSKFESRTAGWSSQFSTLTPNTDNSLLGNLYRDYKGNCSVADHAKVVVERAGGGISNMGYDDVPMAVEEGTDYVFSAFIRTSNIKELVVSVTDGEKDYCSTSIDLSEGNGWVKYSRTLTATDSADSDLSLKLSFSQTGTVYLDGVTFETTDATVGIKNYLYNAVKELSPKFIRFPGGCIVEGENYDASDEQAYDWKNSIGALASGSRAGDDTVPAFTYTLNTEEGISSKTTYGEFVTRKTNTDLWQNDGDKKYYQMEYGIGFYEYFLLCESLGASALPVVNCGLSCQGQTYPVGTGARPLPGRHGQNVDDYIRDATDLIEFAKGDETTKWGAVRIAMGHEKPFEMNYIGIGNEQWETGEVQSNYYTSYYEKFLQNKEFTDACKKYGVQTIVGNHQQLQNCEGYEGAGATGGDAKNAAISYRTKTGNIETLGEYGVQDHHYYNSPIDFFLHTHLYDNYTRTGANRYEVFVGEYSANNAFSYSGNFSNLYKKTNNWLSALSEAAMMTGFERNGDIVKLAAYAPMFAPYDAGARHWGVDMMLFTNTQLVRTPNYFVQQLFMNNFGSRKISSELTFAEGFEPQVTFKGVGPSVQATVDKLYYVASLDEATGDVLVKIVNIADRTVKLNLDCGDFAVKGGERVRLDSDADAVSTLEREEGAPTKDTVGGFTNNVAGIALRSYSVTLLRLHTA